MENPVPFNGYVGKNGPCPGCGTRQVIQETDAVAFHGYKGFGMVTNWADLSISCSACGSEIRFEVHHAVDILIPRMFFCRSCNHAFDHGLTSETVSKLAKESGSIDKECPYCSASNHYSFPGCLGDYAKDYLEA